MINTSRLSVFYSFWTNQNNIERLKLEKYLSQYSYLIESAQIGNDNYYVLGSSNGEPLLYFNINSEFSDNTDVPDYMPEEITQNYKFHCDLLMNASKNLHSLIAALDLLCALSELYEGKILDLSAQKVLSVSSIKNFISGKNFKIEDHISVHFVEDQENGSTWLHTHGMEKFGLPNIETFDITRDNLLNARQLMNDLANHIFAARVEANSPILLPNGKVALMYESDVKEYLPKHLQSMISVHKSDFYVLVDFDTAGNINSACKDYFFYKIAGKNTHKILPDEFSFFKNKKNIEFYVEFSLGKQWQYEVLWGKLLPETSEIKVLIEPIFNKNIFKNSLIPLNEVIINFYVAFNKNKTLSLSELNNL